MKQLQIVFFSLCLLIVVSCIKHDFDAPPIKVDSIPFTANSSIAELKNRYVAGKFVDITDELNIIATVIADDASGNFYKTIVIQDSTAGIELKINRSGIYTTYPIGMKIGVKCKGLTIGDYGGLIQLGKGTYLNNGRSSLSGLEDAVANQFVFAGPRNQTFIPKVKRINDLRFSELSTLIQFDDVEFVDKNPNQTFATVGGGSFLNLDLTSCDNNKIILHNSDFADFSGDKIPVKNGTIVGVFGKFNADNQLLIRNLNDVQFAKDPCGGSGGQDVSKSILEIRKLFSGTTINISDNYKIKGVVISDRTTNNINGQNLFLQDATAGIALRFTAKHSFNVGDELELSVTGVELSDFKGLLQLNNLKITSPKLISSGNTVTPKVVSIKNLNTSIENYESQLVIIKNAKLSKSSGNTYSGTVKVDDNTDVIDLFTAFTVGGTIATFANDVFPTSTVDVVAIASQFTSNQLLLRNLSDVTVIGGGGTVELKSIQEIRSLFSGTKLNIANDYKIKGIVTSEKNALNIVAQNIYIQDNSSAIAVRFTATQPYNLGDEIEVNVKGMELSEFNGLLQINNVPLANSSLINIGQTITPKSLTIQQVIDQFEALEGQLVKISNVNMSKSSGSTYSGTVILNDGTNSIDMFTRSQALFSGTAFNVTPVSVTAIVSQFTSKQLLIRTLADIVP
jgi:hypothetical protein